MICQYHLCFKQTGEEDVDSTLRDKRSYLSGTEAKNV